METKIDILEVILIKRYEFEAKFNVFATDVVLPLFMKEHIYRQMIDSGDVMVGPNRVEIMGLKVHWTYIDHPDAIQVMNIL